MNWSRKSVPSDKAPLGPRGYTGALDLLIRLCNPKGFDLSLEHGDTRLNLDSAFFGCHALTGSTVCPVQRLVFASSLEDLATCIQSGDR